MSYDPGQIWKDRRRSPAAMFLILRVYERKYKDGNTAERVKGVITSEDDTRPGLRDLDSRSMALMFPYLVYNPVVEDVGEMK